jgi:sugar/nucleoside kinase (ribokinase family)
MGGGHSVTAAKEFGFLDKFSYVSLAGGALIKFLSEKELPGISSLEKSYEKFNPDHLDFIVIGSNTIDTEVSVPKDLDQIHLGDKVKINEDFKETVGGGGVNVSVCISRLSGKVGYIGKLSYEKIDKIKDVLEKNKVKIVTEKCSNIPIAKSIILDIKDKDRIIFSYRGQNSSLSEKDFKDIDFSKSNYYYLTSLTGKSFEALLKVVKKIKKENHQSKICYNPSLYLIKDENKKIKSMLNYIDILILNLEEAFELFNKDNLKDIESEFERSNLDILIITNGSHGSFAYSKKGGKIFQKAKKVKVVDSTGAGDCFSGTFFYFYSKHYPLKKCLEYASINSASVVSKKGTLDGLLYFEDLTKN